ncbi:MAG: hypothetical protein PHX50_13885 [Massilibacteroides sp.]|nr:hypothetical protein [Massilibacteroides sp.]
MITFSEEQKRNYIKRLVGKVWKMLPIREGSEEDFKLYYQSIIAEIDGAQKIFNDSMFFLDLMAKLNALPSLYFDEKNDANHKNYKNRVIECVNIVNKIAGELYDKDKE